jgi:hypothetical protein
MATLVLVVVLPIRGLGQEVGGHHRRQVGHPADELPAAVRGDGLTAWIGLGIPGFVVHGLEIIYLKCGS